MNNLTFYESKLDNIQIDIDYANSGKITNYHKNVTNKLVDKARIIFNDNSIDYIRLSRILRIANRLFHPLFNILFNIIDYLNHNDIKNLLLTCISFNTIKVQSNILEYLKNNFFIYDITFDDPYFILNNYHRKSNYDFKTFKDKIKYEDYCRFNINNKYELTADDYVYSIDQYYNTERFYINIYNRKCTQIYNSIKYNCSPKLILEIWTGNYTSINNIAKYAVKHNKYILLKELINKNLITNIRYLIPIAEGRLKELLLKYKYHYMLYSKDRPVGEYVDYCTDDSYSILQYWRYANNIFLCNNMNRVMMTYGDYNVQKAMIEYYISSKVVYNIIRLGKGTNFEVIKFGIDKLPITTTVYNRLLQLSHNVEGVTEYLTSGKFFYNDKSGTINITRKDVVYSYYSYEYQEYYIKHNLGLKLRSSNWWLNYIRRICKYFTDIKLIDYIIENVEFKDREINIINKLVDEL